jgi:hypothetical protein
MKNRSNVHYLDGSQTPTRWYDWLGLGRVIARFQRTAAVTDNAPLSENDLRVQEYLDRLRDQGPVKSGGQVMALPWAAAGEDEMRDAA